MKKYFYFMTSADVWFDQAAKLYDESIAEPVFWLGDDCHKKKAKSKFKDCYIADMNTVIHYPWRLQNSQYLNAHSEFFWSENYIRCKDICIKMMDRLDHIGMFSRIDRELYLKNIALWVLEKIADSKPDALIVAEAPHSHGQYLIYEIFLYLNIPVARFISWSIQPIVQLQRVQESEFIKCKTSFEIPEWTDMNDSIMNYIEKINQSESSEDFSKGVSEQKKNNVWIKTLLGDVSNVTHLREDFKYHEIFSKEMFRLIFRETYRNWRFKLNKEYLPVNPQYLGFFLSNWIKRNKRLKLRREYFKHIEEIDLNHPYIYFALHYEPERTTNPDGEEFHDQILALIAIRKILPDNVFIYVKEHPSQFYIAKGARGRSPLFYDSIKRIKGVKLVDTRLDSSELIKKSLFVATITGTVSIEASILGTKTLYFGNAWYAGMPNTIRWHKKLKYEEIKTIPNAVPQDIYDFLINLKLAYGVPCFRNAEGVNDISSKNKTKVFAKAELIGVSHLLKEFWTQFETKDYQQSISTSDFTP